MAHEIVRINIAFPVPVAMTDETNRFLEEALTAICEDYEIDNPGRVMWVFGQGGTPPPGFFFDEPKGDWDMSVLNIEIAERERYDNEKTIQRSDLRRAFHERDKFRDQVIDTCKRAERAEQSLRDETGWLIERRRDGDMRPEWFTLENDMTEWTGDSLHALRFARKVDAERALPIFAGDCDASVTEHEWIGARLSPSLASQDHPQEK